MADVKDYRLEPPPAIECPPCPMCGTEMYDYLVLDIDNDVVGCSECVRQKDPYEYLEMLQDEGW